MRTIEGMRIYNRNAKHRAVLVGFDYEGNEYAYLTDSIPACWTYWDKCRGSKVLRMRLSDKTKRKLIKLATCEYIGKTADIFNNDCGLNKGEQFEKLTFEIITGQPWTKDFTPWDEGADIETSIYMIQVKREHCTISSYTRLKSYA